jgi:hypothetical protein
MVAANAVGDWRPDHPATDQRCGIQLPDDSADACDVLKQSNTRRIGCFVFGVLTAGILNNL